jgi:hypothetical protein
MGELKINMDRSSAARGAVYDMRYVHAWDTCVGVVLASSWNRVIAQYVVERPEYAKGGNWDM